MLISIREGDLLGLGGFFMMEVPKFGRSPKIKIGMNSLWKANNSTQNTIVVDILGPNEMRSYFHVRA